PACRRMLARESPTKYGASLPVAWWASLRRQSARLPACAWHRDTGAPHPATAPGEPRNRKSRYRPPSCARSLLLGLQLLDPAIAALFKLMCERAVAGAHDAAA